MATIFNPIDKTIADQIDVRQGIMAGTITNQHARNTYLNKACVVKLIPLVKDTSLQPTNYNDFIFDNFTLKDNFFNSRDFKYNDKVEKPFIQNIEITSRSGNNYGATRTGKLTLIIPTKNQFNLIERYFRIGTAFLLEWGWGTYVDNTNSVNTIQRVDDLYYKENEVNETALENAILTQREFNQGNYDGGIFYITNFTTNIQNNATDYYYELTINMVSKGDILNSLEPNTPLVIDPDSENSTSIDDKIKNNPLIKYLDNLEKGIANPENPLTTSEEVPRTGTTTSGEIEGTTQTGTIIVPNDTTNNLRRIPDSLKDFTPNNNFITIRLSKPLPGGDPYAVYVTAFTDQKFNGGTKEESISYVKLRFILNLLSALVENSSEYVEQNQTYGLPLYYCTLEPSTPNPTFYKWKWEPYNHFASFNPERVVLPHYLLRDLVTVSSIKNFLSKEKDTNDRFKIGGILIRTKFLIDEISNLIKDNKFSFNNILDLILREINQWTDNELNLIKYDVDGTNKYSVVSLKSTDLIGEILPELKLYGKGSIVEQVDIDTVISNELSSQVAIMMNGSTNYKIDPMATSLLKFNTGIKSRLKRSEVTPNRRNPGGYLGAIKTIHERNHKFLSEQPIDVPPYQDSLDQFRKFKQDYSDAIVENSAYDGIQGTPLFPIKIRTTLPGISGIVIGNKLKIEDVRLPDIYTSNKVYYVVTNQQSKIENRYWQTFLDLSPQINTDVKGKSTQDTSDPNVVQTSQIPPVKIELLLDAIKNIESPGYEFLQGTLGLGPKWKPKGEIPNTSGFVPGTNVPLSSDSGWRTFPLYSGGTRPSSPEKRARGPYQMRPAAFVDAMRELKYPENEIAKVAKNTSTDPGKPKWEWAYPSKFESIIDTIGSTTSRANARALAKAYIERYQKQLQPDERTYLRLLSIYYLGSSAASNTLRTRNKTGFLDQAEEQDKNGSYTKYLTDGRTLLQNAGVPNNELNDPFIQKNILPSLSLLT
jgi:hypothetical protein